MISPFFRDDPHSTLLATGQASTWELQVFIFARPLAAVFAGIATALLVVTLDRACDGSSVPEPRLTGTPPPSWQSGQVRSEPVAAKRAEAAPKSS